MKHSQGIAAALAELGKAGTSVNREAASATLRKALAARTPSLVADAARIAADLSLRELEAELRTAFADFAGERAKADKQCAAKTAIVQALHQLGCTRMDIFIQGARLFWPDVPRGRQSDEAAELRIACAIALVDGDQDAHETLLELLADPVAKVRAMAARCIGTLAEPLATMLLRLKLLIGPDEPVVAGECLEALLKADAERSLAFVARFLDSPDDRIRTSAAIALGECRHAPVCALLIARTKREFSADFRATLLHAVAMQRQEAGTQFLLAIIEEGGANASDALLSLVPYQSLAGIGARVHAAVEKSRQTELQEIYRRKFRG